MFHRRVALLLAACAAAGAALSLQLANLTLLQGERRLAAAERALVTTSWLPTRRGRILDRWGRVLARDRAAYDVAVSYEVIGGEWPARHARALARAAAGDAWPALPDDQRDARVARAEAALRAHADRLWDRLADATGADRGTLAARADAVRNRVDRIADAVSESRFRRLVDDELARGRGMTAQRLTSLRAQARVPVAEERDHHVLLGGVDDDRGFDLLRLADRRVPVLPAIEGDPDDPALLVPLLPGVRIVDAPRRERPLAAADATIDGSTLPGPLRQDSIVRVPVPDAAAHLLGSIRDRVYAEDAAARAEALETDAALRDAALTESGEDRGRYLPGDGVGATGVEAAMEHHLRGLRGVRTRRLDTGVTDRTEPTPGRDVHLTIDGALQARVRAAIDPELGLTTVQAWHGETPQPLGTPLAAAAVVLDVHSGEILAMASTPSPTGDESRGPSAGAEDGADPFAGVDPYVNRAVAAPYPPGSIVKPLMLAGAVTRGAHTLGSGIECTGHLLPGRPDLYRCWIYKRYGTTHTATLGGPVRAADSLMVSCNVFYYEIGRRLGPQGVRAVYEAFGLGTPFGLGIGPEWPGATGDETGRVEIGEAILLAIGQGPVSWTPLHAANAYATLARGGVWLPPRLLRDGTAAEARDLGLDQRAVREALRGLDLAVNDPRGTGATIAVETPAGARREPIFNAPGLRLWGKTGTAEAPPLLDDPDGDGPLPAAVVREGDHSWFVVLAGTESAGPQYAIAVVVEYGGSGGRVSGPVTNQIVHALVAEGYLPAATPGDETPRAARASR